MLWIVSVKTFNRATGMQINGQYAVCPAIQRGGRRVGGHDVSSRLMCSSWSKRHISGVLVLEMKQLSGQAHHSCRGQVLEEDQRQQSNEALGTSATGYSEELGFIDALPRIQV